MNEHWSDYRRELRRYLRLLPIGPPLSLLPLVFTYERWSDEGRLLTGVIVSLCYGVTIPLTNMAMFAAVYAVLTMIAVRTGRFYNRPLIFFVLVATVATVAGIWLSQIVKSMVLGVPVEGGTFFTSLIFGGSLIVLFSLYQVYRQAKEEALTLRAAVAESRYNALEHQMRPHFLFNALNSLAELIESRNERAAEMTYTLSDLYRQILANSKLKTAPLESEIEIARQYLELEKVRFGSRLSYSITVAGRADGLFVPSLMIQTLVENAVKHGVSKSLAGGHITIELCPQPGGLYGLKVTNTGEPFGGNGSEGTGLANTRARLGLLYGDRHHFHIGRDDEGRTVASFQFSGEKID
jgi:two-component system, LytTR family, sensor kinase